ncbi:transcription factor sma-9-like [Haliotis asinina]|uniref:transcription factor sma-9-like n=1 Tax=Haliotis asinina TaxID=109174 RepID=UPI0035319F8C
MTSVNILVGCLAVMGSVPSNEENGDPLQDIQHQQLDGAPLQQVRPPRDRTPVQQQNVCRIPPQQDLIQLLQFCDGLDPGDTQSKAHVWRQIKHQTQLEFTRVVYTSDELQTALNLQRWIQHQCLPNTCKQPQTSTWFELPREQQQKLPQKDDDNTTVPQFSCLIQWLIFAGLFTSILIKTLSKKRQSDQRTIESKDISEQTDQEQSQQKRLAQQVQQSKGQQEQEVRKLRSIGFADPCRQSVASEKQGIQTREAAIPSSAVPSRQGVEPAKTVHVISTATQLLADLRTQLEAAATESATAACKQRLFNTCAGGLRAAARC